MDIRLVKGRYKSISALEWRGIPKFALVTGANGSGKTQLLELIARRAGLLPQPPGAFNPRDSDNEPFEAEVECSDRLDSQSTVFLRSYWEISDAQASIQQLREAIDDAWNAREAPVQEGAARMRNVLWDPLWSSLERSTGTGRNDIERTLFNEALPPNFVLMKEGATNPTSMYATVPLLFLSYAVRAHYLKRRGASEEEISKRLGELPWVAVNDALRGAGLRYEAFAPTVVEADWTEDFHASYRLQLHDRQTGTVIPPSSLSSGERVIFMVAIWSYFFNQSALTSRTALLLLDEPDAHLHPALTSVFLRVVRRELIEKRGIRVIATTHSPSTVALAGDEELFVMSSETPRLSAVKDKWQAVARLTAGVVTVGTDTKAVFVEDVDDAAFFRVVQTILNSRRFPDIDFDASRSLTFIPASKGRSGGGKNMVIGWVEDIQTNQVAGVVDRDGQPDPGDRVHAVVRRHLESYLLDPLFLYAYLLDENIEDRPDFAPEVTHQQSKSLSDLPPATLQLIANGMLEIYATLVRSNKAADSDDVTDLTDTTPEAVKYSGGATVQLPRWFMKCDMKKLIRPLRDKYKAEINHDRLTRRYEVLNVLPADLADLLVEIQRA